MNKRLLTTIVVWMTTLTMSMAQLGLKVTVHCEDAGTLFVKIQEQIEEIGELSDVTELTVTGAMNYDDCLVIRNQLTNLTLLDVGGIDAESAKVVELGYTKLVQKVILPQTATELHKYVLRSSKVLTTIVMPPNLTAIPEGMFYECPFLEQVDIPETVTSIGSYAFSGCVLLASINLPTGVTSIGYRCFYNCPLLKSITIPDGVTTLDGDVFRGCSQLSQVKLPSQLEIIKDGAFRGTALETFTLPAGVKLQGDAIFGECEKLTTFTFPDGLKDASEIGTSTLWHCYNLTTVRLPQDLTEIPKYFFSGTAIPSIELPTTVTAVRDGAFEYTTAIKKVTFPSHVKEIGEGVFYDSKIEEVEWPSHLTMIPKGTFYWCENLQKVTIPEMVDSIGSDAFAHCSSLKSIRLPEGIRTLSGTFYKTPLESVNIPSTVKIIERSTFDEAKFTHIDIPEGVTYIGAFAFRGVPLAEVKLPSTLRRIASYAFNGGEYEKVVVPEGVTSIGSRVFYSKKLRVLDLPSTLIAIDELILGDMGNAEEVMDSVIIRAMVPPYWKSNVFSYYDRKVNLYVPAPSVSLYQADDGFNIVNNILALKDAVAKDLNITWRTVVDKNSTIQQGKYDVNYIYISGYNEETSSNHHPCLRVEEGAKLQAGHFNMTYDIDAQYWFTDYKFQTFINQGTTTIDQIDLRCHLLGQWGLTLPFDVKYSDIVPEKPATSFALFRYDGAARARGDFDKTWIRVKNDETLKAGQGYYFMSEQTGYYNTNGQWTRNWDFIHFKSHAGGTDYFTTAKDVTLPLYHYPGEFAHNINWNFIGQPYPAFLDIRGVDYDGPIMVYQKSTYSYSTRWKAFSALDDEEVLDPLIGFFVQVPDGVNDITFEATRRQHVKTFTKGETANSRMALRRADKNSRRMVYNLLLTQQGGEGETVQLDRTRFVINPEATLRYDIGRDAPKINDSEGAVNAIFTKGEGVAYDINERPLGNGIVQLGMEVAEAGTYTLSMTTKGTSTEEIWLIDNDEHTRTLLSEPYTFTVSNPATLSTRFIIAIGNAEATAVTEVETAQPMRSDAIFNLSGHRLSEPQRGINIVNGKKYIK